MSQSDALDHLTVTLSLEQELVINSSTGDRKANK